MLKFVGPRTYGSHSGPLAMAMVAIGHLPNLALPIQSAAIVRSCFIMPGEYPTASAPYVAAGSTSVPYRALARLFLRERERETEICNFVGSEPGLSESVFDSDHCSPEASCAPQSQILRCQAYLGLNPKFLVLSLQNQLVAKF